MFAAGSFSAAPFSTSASFIYDPAVAEDVLGTDVYVAGLPLSVNVLDESSVSQETMTALVVLPASVQESAIFAERRFVGYGFSAGSFASGAFSALGEESILTSGAVASATIEFTYAFSEGASALFSVRSGPEYTGDIAESATASDQTSSIPTYPTAFSDSATGTSIFSNIPTYLCRIEDVASGSVTDSSLVELIANVLETAVPVDRLTTNFTVNSAVSEVIVLTDRPFTQYITRPVFVDMAQATDRTEARLQWENINTFETADWTLIDTNK